MSQLPSVRSVQFIDNYFPVIDGVTETVHEYARHMENAVVVCPAMESRYLEKHDFPYPVLPSLTSRVPFSRYASAVPMLDRKLKAQIAADDVIDAAFVGARHANDVSQDDLCDETADQA